MIKLSYKDNFFSQEINNDVQLSHYVLRMVWISETLPKVKLTKIGKKNILTNKTVSQEEKKKKKAVYHMRLLLFCG